VNGFFSSPQTQSVSEINFQHLGVITATAGGSGVARIWCEEGHKTKRK